MVEDRERLKQECVQATSSCIHLTCRNGTQTEAAASEVARLKFVPLSERKQS